MISAGNGNCANVLLRLHPYVYAYVHTSAHCYVLCSVIQLYN